jgi:hypothetical protein
VTECVVVGQYSARQGSITEMVSHAYSVEFHASGGERTAVNISASNAPASVEDEVILAVRTKGRIVLAHEVGRQGVGRRSQLRIREPSHWASTIGPQITVLPTSPATRNCMCGMSPEET